MKDIYHLHNPTYLELDDTYRSLQVLKSVQIKSSDENRVIRDLEKIGFVAIEIKSYLQEESNHTIQAFKGKHGPCHYTGNKVKYTGAALAALDDDNHLLFSNSFMTVCDKTSRILSLPPYQGLIEGKHDDQKTGIEEDLESRQDSLYEQLSTIGERSDQRKTLFYHGPFRILILLDGSILYRGKWCSVPLNLSPDLITQDRCIQTTDENKGHLSYFQEEYNKSGSAWLLNDFKPEVPRQPDYETDFSKLTVISEELKSRLLQVIDNHKKYFILIGNEVDDKIGCCPSQEVTEANLLVRHGILSSLAEPLKGDSCPVTLYAFKDELSLTTSGGFSSELNEEFRRNIHVILSKSPHSIWMKILKWILLVFIIFSLVIAARKCQNLRNTNFDESLYEQLNVSSESQHLVVLFHNQKRCFQCRQMEIHAIDLLNVVYSNDFESEGLKFKTVVIDDPENRNMVDMFGIFAPTLVLLEFDQKELVKSKVLLDATRLYREEKAFKDLLDAEIHQFLIEDDR